MEHIFLLVQKLTDIGAAATAAAVILNEGSVGDAQVILAQNGIEQDPVQVACAHAYVTVHCVFYKQRRAA